MWPSVRVAYHTAHQAAVLFTGALNSQLTTEYTTVRIMQKSRYGICAFQIFPDLSTTLGCIQERATKISHGNTARHAKDYGDPVLGKICGHIASDEGRHEIAYQRIVEKFFEL